MIGRDTSGVVGEWRAAAGLVCPSIKSKAQRTCHNGCAHRARHRVAWLLAMSTPCSAGRRLKRWAGLIGRGAELLVAGIGPGEAGEEGGRRGAEDRAELEAWRCAREPAVYPEQSTDHRSTPTTPTLPIPALYRQCATERLRLTITSRHAGCLCFCIWCLVWCLASVPVVGILHTEACAVLSRIQRCVVPFSGLAGVGPGPSNWWWWRWW